MARKMTEVEKFYILNHPYASADALSKTIKGVGVRAIQEVLELAKAVHDAGGIVVETKEVEPLKAGDKGESALKGKTEEEVKEIVQSDADAHRSGNLFARREGVVVMTEAAGELADARRVLAVAQPNKDNSNKIHVINKNRKSR
jgi:hypothetical protein